jgi:hypothetical protein
LGFLLSHCEHLRGKAAAIDLISSHIKCLRELGEFGGFSYYHKGGDPPLRELGFHIYFSGLETKNQ